MSSLMHVGVGTACIVALLSLSVDARATSCGDGTFDRSEESCDDGNNEAGDGCSPDCAMECREVNAAATEHTCLHGSLGPFATRGADAYPGPAREDVNPTHTYYTIVLRGEPSENRSVVAFRPVAALPYAIYLEKQYPLRLLDANGVEQLPILEHAISSCAVPDSLTWVRVHAALDPAVYYTLDIGPWPERSVALALESLGFEKSLFRDADGDDFGVANESAFSWCVPSTGYSDRSGDCDDDSAIIHPGAAEVCDGLDNDCDRTADEAGASLCEDAATGTVCLSAAGTAYCGCVSDADCASGDACEKDSRTCGSTPGGAGQPGNTGSAGAGNGGGDGGPHSGGAGGLNGTGHGGDRAGRIGATESGAPPISDAGAAGVSVGAAGSGEASGEEGQAVGEESGCGCRAVGSSGNRAFDGSLLLGGGSLALVRWPRRRARRQKELLAAGRP